MEEMDMRKWKRRRGRKRRKEEVGRRDKEHISCFLMQHGWLAN